MKTRRHLQDLLATACLIEFYVALLFTHTTRSESIAFGSIAVLAFLGATRRR